jgi:hypothetical protein
MLRDVATPWNSRYNMLVFALEYCKAIDIISGDKDMRKYELDEEEWEIVWQLCEALEVSCACWFPISVTNIFQVIQGRNPLLFVFDTEPRHCDSRNGSH